MDGAYIRMLIDDPHRLVKLFVDNIIWGDIEINWDGVDKYGKQRSEKFVNCLVDYLIARNHAEDRVNLEKMTLALATEFKRWRIVGEIKGKLQDRNLEDKVELLRKENANVTKELSKARDAEAALKKPKPIDTDFKAFK